MIITLVPPFEIFLKEISIGGGEMNRSFRCRKIKVNSLLKRGKETIMAIIGMVDVESHGIESWQKKEDSRLAMTAAKKKAVEDRRKKVTRRRENADQLCFDAQWGVEKRRLERELGRRMTRRERKSARAEWLAEQN